jgi:hypothetical protein
VRLVSALFLSAEARTCHCFFEHSLQCFVPSFQISISAPQQLDLAMIVSLNQRQMTHLFRSCYAQVFPACP